MDYAVEYTALHASRDDIFQGYSVMPHVARIDELIKSTGARTLLDYGCGKGFQYSKNRIHKVWGIMPTLYDPGVPEFADQPHKHFDGVICTDVMEHIEQGDVMRTLKDVFHYSKRFVFFSISCRAAKKEFGDGRNVHRTIKPSVWWQRKIEKAAKGRTFLVVFDEVD